MICRKNIAPASSALHRKPCATRRATRAPRASEFICGRERMRSWLQCKDDGAGFDPAESKGLGILGMEERALHAEAHFASPRNVAGELSWLSNCRAPRCPPVPRSLLVPWTPRASHPFRWRSALCGPHRESIRPGCAGAASGKCCCGASRPSSVRYSAGPRSRDWCGRRRAVAESPSREG